MHDPHSDTPRGLERRDKGWSEQSERASLELRYHVLRHGLRAVCVLSPSFQADTFSALPYRQIWRRLRVPYLGDARPRPPSPATLPRPTRTKNGQDSSACTHSSVFRPAMWAIDPTGDIAQASGDAEASRRWLAAACGGSRVCDTRTPSPKAKSDSKTFGMLNRSQTNQTPSTYAIPPGLGKPFTKTLVCLPPDESNTSRVDT